jgi:hypothetical protein
MAHMNPFCLCFTINTSPKRPLPSFFPIKKSSLRGGLVTCLCLVGVMLYDPILGFGRMSAFLKLRDCFIGIFVSTPWPLLEEAF